ncbi:TPA: hypothetical protein ACT9IY_002888 [Legionella pneumophila]|nr:hypothetical protein [Legionella pneumophila]HCZ0415267.1 hypothetical protein [Legionella pneumophila]HDE5451011.1 hypothetical protein [Legionella pneumophila]
MSNIFDDIRLYLPKYLSDDELTKLLSELRQHSNNLDKRIYTSALKEEPVLFQGDGFSNISMPDIANKKFYTGKGILVSNSCDSSLENSRVYNPYITFTPLFSLKKYEDGLLTTFDKSKVTSHIKSIREQGVSSFFYLPSTETGEEYFARFDLCFSMSLTKQLHDHLLENKLFTLSNYGFYLLLIKLSIHFSRVQEKVQRNP